MGDEYWQETAEMYGQLFEKPRMTQKLLSKPPFRYLHDIFTATSNATGYGTGLFDGDELNAKAITEKDAKINFLLKLIQLTELVVGEQIDVKPTKIVAGHEPEKTNAFLQMMFKAATAGIDTTPHVQQVLAAGGEGEQAEDPKQEDDMQAAQAQAEAEEAERQAQEQEVRRQKKKEQERRRKEEERQRIQEEEEERKREEIMEQQRLAEMHSRQQREQEMKQNQNLIRDGDDGAQDDGIAQDDDDDMPRGVHQQFDDGAAHSKVVQEAKALMQNDEEDDAGKGAQEDTGPKIKMGRIGKKKKKSTEKSAAANEPSQSYTKKIASLSSPSDIDGGRAGEGFNEGDVEFMKKAIQILCQSTNPLGKSIDFVTDDVDSMSKEYEHWRKEAIQCNQQLEEAQKVTEELVQPLQDQLAELEEKIREQQGKVNSIKSQILRNDITVGNLLYSVIQTR